MTRILGIIPARGGSKGFPGKNTRPLRGKPLIHWSARALMQAGLPDTRICSTDSETIADCVRETGIEVPWLRPHELALDNTPTVDVLVHALKEFHKQDIQFSHVVLVQPTSPTVLPQDIDDAIELALNRDADTVISGFQSHHAHPSLTYTLDPDQQVSWLLPETERKSRRQDFSPVFIRTGLIYVVSADVLLDKHTIYGERTYSMEIPEDRSITIDTEFDFRIAELMLENMHNE